MQKACQCSGCTSNAGYLSMLPAPLRCNGCRHASEEDNAGSPRKVGSIPLFQDFPDAIEPAFKDGKLIQESAKVEESPKRWTHTWKVDLDRSSPDAKELGLTWIPRSLPEGPGLVVQTIYPGLVQDWNNAQKHCTRHIKVSNRIVSVNGLTDNGKMANELQQASVLQIVVARE